MRPTLFLIITSLAVVWPAGSSAPSGTETPRLVVEAERLHMLPPGMRARGYAKRIEFRARLDGEIEDPETYYCLDEVWEWGDGTESVHEPDCDPYEEGKELKTQFNGAHHFGPGSFYVTLALMHLDEVVVRGSFEIRVY